MEDNIQVIVGIIISVFLFFVFPVYMAYEKKDDIAYALALRYTQDFVDEVKNKGYFTENMLNKYKEKLVVTGNTYDIQLTHTKKRLDPVTKYYKTVDDTDVLIKTTTREYQEYYEIKRLMAVFGDGASYESILNMSEEDKQYILDRAYRNVGIDRVEETYIISEEQYTTNHIEAVLANENKMWIGATTENFVCVDDDEAESFNTITKRVKGCEKVYIMNKDDEFNVTIKNTNTTLATALYNMVTVNSVDNNTRIYINYGGKILNEKWYGKIDYTKMKHDTEDIDNMTDRIVKLEAIKFDKTGDPNDFIRISEAMRMGKEYMLEFEVKPFDPTELREKGYELTNVNDESVYSLYNFAAGIHPYTGGLQVSVGINGICLLISDELKNSKVILSYPMTIAYFTKIRLKIQKTDSGDKYQVILYVNDERVAESIELNELPYAFRVGQGFLSSRGVFGYRCPPRLFSGYIRNVRLYYEED